jgi:sulfoxide reductase heme-binding subunit YedZ
VNVSQSTIRWILKPLAFLAALAPFVWLVWAALTNNLSANPLSDITLHTGDWAIRFICITLAISPLRQLTGWHWLIKFRRMAGLFAFFYGTTHFLIYVIADRFAGLDFPNGIVSFTTVRSLVASVGADIYKRPFITIGFLTWLLMAPLALTSTAGMIRRLGGKRWQALHRVIYVVAITAVIHYWWLVKIDIRPPLRYAIVVGVLLGARMIRASLRARHVTGPRVPAAAPASKAR